MLDPIFLFILILLSIWSVYHFFTKNDEVPVLITLYSLLVLYRIPLLESGEAEWVDFDYGINFLFNMELAYKVGNLILIGTNLLTFFYLINYKEKTEKRDSSDLFYKFLDTQKSQILIGFALFALFSFLTKGKLGTGYSFLLTLANSSFVILMFLVFFKLKTNTLQRSFFAIFMVVIASSTYGAALRFQFLGWAIPIFIYLASRYSPTRRSIYYVLGSIIILVFFSIAGVKRSKENKSAEFSDLYSKSLDRILVTEDINFIDGFIMLYQVYPDYLDYHYGMDHLAILLRPIPRDLWPEKPVGAWQQKYAQKYGFESEVIVGISTTIYGVFYGEGGKIGVIVFSVLWGFFLAYLTYWRSGFGPDLNTILKGMILASLIPILRSGDMAGDFAIVGMSYWPICIFIYRYIRFCKNEKLQSYINKDVTINTMTLNE